MTDAEQREQEVMGGRTDKEIVPSSLRFDLQHKRPPVSFHSGQTETLWEGSRPSALICSRV